MKTNNQGKLIVIEGNDGSGKTTQFNLLKKRLNNTGHKVHTIKFPQHGESFFGKMVDEYLNGKFGNAPKVDPHLASLIYAADRWQAKKQMDDWLDSGTIVLLDRYMTANKGHQISKLDSDEKKFEMLKWLDEMEYVTFDIPRPDIVFYFNVPMKFNLLKNRDNKGKGYIDGDLDGHEKDSEYLSKTNEAFLFTAQQYDYWKVIECVENEKLLKPEVIHEKVWQIINKL